jgi:adenylate kinase family enzyme
VQRVSVVGTSGSGKSTIGRAIAERLEVPYLELDGVFHQPGWTPLPDDEFMRRVAAIASETGWVIDGNYGTVQPLVWERAEAVLWLDFPHWLVMARIIRRSIGRVVRRTELWNGNREDWRTLVARDPKKSVIRWAWTQHRSIHDRYATARDDPRWSHIWFVQARSPKEAAAFVGWLTPAAAARDAEPGAPWR